MGDPRRAVFLDRDGVINQTIVRDGKPYPPQKESDCTLTAGAYRALERLHQSGFELIVVTNQPDVARGTQSREAVEAISERLHRELPMIDAFYTCFHDDRDACRCRKPKPGLVLDAARDRAIDLHRSYMVGDRWRDIAAGQGAGVKTVFIDYGYDERQPDSPDARVGSLPEAVDWILAHPVDPE